MTPGGASPDSSPLATPGAAASPTVLPAPLHAVVNAWRRLRSWRRIRFTRAGAIYVVGSFAIGFAAINTGNNLLYLMLGAMLGSVGMSGWLSERTIRGLRVVRRVPRGGHAGDPIPIHYRVTNGKRVLASYALELQEPGLADVAFVASVPAGETATTTVRQTFLDRGVYPLKHLTLATDFPFGLFRKERDVPVPGEIVVWPRTDLPVRSPAGGAGRGTPRAPAAGSREAGARGEYRSLREYRPGDDIRDVHWKATARTGRAVVREYERPGTETVWVSLDVSTEAGQASERAADMTASLIARQLREGSAVALHAGDRVVPSGIGPNQLERVLDALARVEFGSPDAPPPVSRGRCVRVTAGARPRGWADAILVRTGVTEPEAP